MPDRRLAAVMITDMVGFTAMMGANQQRALELVGRTHEILRSIVSAHDGDWLEDAGDRSMSAFPSAIKSVECALEIQATLKNEPDLKLRIGLDIGDIVVARGHAYGDTVNIASYIERLADPEGLVITEAVYDAVHSQIDLNVIDLGEKALKNIGHSVKLYALTGAERRSSVVNFFSTLSMRRVPHITGGYLAASWAIVEVTEWLAEKNVVDSRWVYAVFVGLLALIPSVLLVTYLHGAHGADQVQKAEKFGVPLNILLAALLIAFTFQTADVRQPIVPVEAASVAVLPFVNMSGDESNEYFSRGLSEELINALAKIPGLYVASRTSSFIFDGHDEDPRDIARKLRVATILEGSVRSEDGRVRVTAQLINGESNYHLWTEIYEREFADIFDIQEGIAVAVAEELVGILQPEVASALVATRAASLEAYDYYLQGLSYLRKPATHESLNDARGLFNQALSNDANYAQAFAGLCEVSLEQYVLDRSATTIDAAANACSKALQIDDGLREVKYALGELFRHTGDFEESATVFNELLDSQRTGNILVGLGRTRQMQGDFFAAEALLLEAVDREPGNWHNRLAYADFLYDLGRFAESISELEIVIDLSPDNARAFLLMAASYDYLGDSEKMLEMTLKSIEIEPSRAGYRDLGLTYYFDGDYERAIDAFRHATRLGPKDYASWGDLALTYQLIGDQNRAASDAYARAAVLAAELLERNPKDWVTLARLGVYTVMNGDVEDGVDKIATAVREGQHIAEVHVDDAIIHMQMGQQKEALDALERAIDLGSPVRMIAADPLFADLKSKGRFKSLIGELVEE